MASCFNFSAIFLDFSLMVGTKVTILFNSTCFSCWIFSLYFLRITISLHFSLFQLLGLIEQSFPWRLEFIARISCYLFRRFDALSLLDQLGIILLEIGILGLLQFLRIKEFIVEGILILQAVIERTRDLMRQFEGRTLDGGVEVGLKGGAEELIEIDLHLHGNLLLKNMDWVGL